MKTIIVKTQAEWDALPERFDEFTKIEIRCDYWSPIRVGKVPDNSRAELRESSRAELWGSSSAELWESSRAELRENSRAVLWGSSSAELWESSRAELWGSSRANAASRSTVHQHSCMRPELRGQAVCFLYDGAGVPVRKSDGARIIQVQPVSGTAGWLENEGVFESDGCVILYKRVSADFLTQEGHPHETKWVIGSTLVHPKWNPKKEECGGGKFHACSRSYFCDEFRSNAGDKYIAIQIRTEDLYAWPNPSYPHKIAFRAGTVLHLVDRWGTKIDTPTTEGVSIGKTAAGSGGTSEALVTSAGSETINPGEAI